MRSGGNHGHRMNGDYDRKKHGVFKEVEEKRPMCLEGIRR